MKRKIKIALVDEDYAEDHSIIETFLIARDSDADGSSFMEWIREPAKMTATH